MIFGKNIKGENIAVCGKVNTGKTFIAMELAKLLQSISGKPIIVYDHSNNYSYNDIDNVVSIEDLSTFTLEDGETYRISGHQDLDEFLYLATHVFRNYIIMLDDCGNKFDGNLSEIQKTFITSIKNNANDIFYQFHNFDDIGPRLLRTLQMVVVKEQATPEIPKKMVCRDLIQILHDEVVAENDKNPPTKLWAWRIYDIEQDRVFFEDKSGKVKMELGRNYFKNKLKRK